MRLDLFEALAPVCPRCRQHAGRDTPLIVAEKAEMRGGLLWHGMLHCSDKDCWAEYPVIDGIPVLVADVPEYLRNSKNTVLVRTDLPASLESLLGDAFGPGSEPETVRHHLSLYAASHFADWIDPESPTPDIVAAQNAGLRALGGPDGVAIDLGGSVGRGGWALGAAGMHPVLVADLNFSMLRLGQTLMLEGSAEFARRRVGLVYDRVRVTRPDAMRTDGLDFWAMDAMALPFRTGAFDFASAINLVDCIAGPTEMLVEMGRIVRGGGGAVVATPHDWTGTATEPLRWMGGHSQRASHGGAAEPVLSATMAACGLQPVAEALDLPWRLGLHARAVMHYSLHLIAARRAAHTDKPG